MERALKTTDLCYRPATYWPAAPTVDQLLSRIKGQARRDRARAIMDREGFAGLSAFIARQKLTDNERARWGAIHPLLMGGEYLPDLNCEEVEIARITLASVTGDQISIRATRLDGTICYSVVDEYETEYALPASQSAEPLTMAELVALIDGTEHPDDSSCGGLVKSHWNFMDSEGASAGEAIRFVQVESGFYPGLSAHYAREARKWSRGRKVRANGKEGNDT